MQRMWSTGELCTRYITGVFRGRVSPPRLSEKRKHAHFLTVPRPLCCSLGVEKLPLAIVTSSAPDCMKGDHEGMELSYNTKEVILVVTWKNVTFVSGRKGKPVQSLWPTPAHTLTDNVNHSKRPTNPVRTCRVVCRHADSRMTTSPVGYFLNNNKKTKKWHEPRRWNPGIPP